MLAVVSAALAWTARPAGAGRTHFGWLRGTESLPERAVELETWVFEQNDVEGGDAPEGNPDQSALWWTTVVGVTDRVEVAVPVEIRHLQLPGEDGSTFFYGFGGEVRWRLVSPDPVEAGPFAPVVRLGAHRLVNQRSRMRGEGGVALSVELSPRVLAAADVEAALVAGNGDSFVELTPAGGVSVRIVDDLRLGGEVVGRSVFGGSDVRWLAAGPNLAWTHGRFWISAALAVGLIDIGTAPRINWAVAF